MYLIQDTRYKIQDSLFVLYRKLQYCTHVGYTIDYNIHTVIHIETCHNHNQLSNLYIEQKYKLLCTFILRHFIIVHIHTLLVPTGQWYNTLCIDNVNAHILINYICYPSPFPLDLWSTSVYVVECNYCLWDKWIPIPLSPVMWLSQSSATFYTSIWKLYCQRVGRVIFNFLCLRCQSLHVVFVKVTLSSSCCMSCLSSNFVQSWSVLVCHIPSPTNYPKQENTADGCSIKRW